MTAALRVVPDPPPCRFCTGDEEARFALVTGFGAVRLVDCPQCSPSLGSCAVWREVLEPYLPDGARGGIA